MYLRSCYTHSVSDGVRMPQFEQIVSLPIFANSMVAGLRGLPGPNDRCQKAIEAIRRDGHVLSVHVNDGPS
jgi:hypothetical protein